jgi:hypothetical protein
MQLKPPVAVSQLNLCLRVKYRSDKMSRTDKNKEIIIKFIVIVL